MNHDLLAVHVLHLAVVDPGEHLLGDADSAVGQVLHEHLASFRHDATVLLVAEDGIFDTAGGLVSMPGCTLARCLSISLDDGPRAEALLAWSSVFLQAHIHMVQLLLLGVFSRRHGSIDIVFFEPGGLVLCLS